MMLGAALALVPLWAAAEVGDDGLHKAPWMQDTFKDLREDMEEAAADGRRLLLMVEQRGCIYCAKMHEEVFPREEIARALSEDYFVVQVNLHGDIEVVDLDGQALSEKDAVAKWGVLFTPTLMFMPLEAEAGASAQEAAVAVMPGAFGPGTTLDMLTWVSEERYLDQSEEDFQRYHARMIRERDNGRTD